MPPRKREKKARNQSESVVESNTAAARVAGVGRGDRTRVTAGRLPTPRRRGTKKKRGRPSNESKGVPSVSCVGGDTLGSCHITTACETCRLCLAHIPENPTCAECIQCLGDCGSSRGNTRASAIYKYDASGTSPARLRPDVEPDLGAYDEGGGPTPSPMVHRPSDDHVRHFPLNHAASGLSDIGVAFGRRFDNIPSARQLDKAMRGETV